MNRTIPDLLDDLYFELDIPECEPVSVQRIQELTLQKIKKSKVKRRPGPRWILIASIIALFSTITVGAAVYTLRDAARTDLGIQEKTINEYTEYSEETNGAEGTSFSDTVMEQYAVENAHIELVSAFCSGDQVTAYLAISPVTPEMAEASWYEVQKPADFAYWSYGFADVVGTDKECRSAVMDSRQIEYDPNNETALIRLDMKGEVFGEATEITLSLTWTRQDEYTAEFKYYGDVRMPVTQSKMLETNLNITLENTFLPGISGKLAGLEVRAGYVTAVMEIPSFYEACDILDENAHYIIGDAYWNYYRAQTGQELDTEFTELDAYVAYHRSWMVSFDELAKDMTLQLHDGSMVVIMEQDSMYAGWSIPVTDSDDDEFDDYMAENTMVLNYDLSTPLELIQVESILVGGDSYLLEAH